ncbi:MAG: hypothetical protein ACK4GQ_04705 [Candidatus Hadarchaeales archaeon]
MTLDQSEFQELVEVLVQLVEKYRGNQAVLEAILEEFRDMYRKIPIYPSIITMCLRRIVDSAKIEELKEGDEVALVLKDGKMVYGKVAGTDENEIKITEATEVLPTPVAEKISIEKKEITNARKIKRNCLEREWPSLNFKEE